MFEDYRRYSSLFVDTRLCSLDESSPDKTDDSRIRHAPIWRSAHATAFCEKLDTLDQILQKELPSCPGRKPGIRKSLSANAPIGGLQVTPMNLPVDCYNSQWLSSQSTEAKAELELKKPIFH